MSRVQNITVLESLFFGRGELVCHELKRRGRKVSAELPLTKGGLIVSRLPKIPKEPCFRVGLQAELIDSTRVLSHTSYATTVNIKTAHNNGEEMEDPLDLPNPFVDALGKVNDQIEDSGSITPFTVADLLSLARPASLTVEGLRGFKGWDDVADKLDLDAGELVALLNERGISLTELAQELGLRVEKIK